MTEVNNFDVRLIDLVSSNPVLYEREIRSTPYDNMKKKNEQWQSIAASLQVDSKVCIMRWKNLRNRLRRELDKMLPGGVGSDWELLDKMRFLEQHVKYHNERNLRVLPQNANIQLDDMNAELLIEELVEDEDHPLQEAMDEQSSEREIMVPMLLPGAIDEVIATNDYANNTLQMNNVPAAPSIVSLEVREEHMRRIDTLLGGLGTANRAKAEKRIIAYLCKCNLRAMNNENIEEIVI